MKNLGLVTLVLIVCYVCKHVSAFDGDPRITINKTDGNILLDCNVTSSEDGLLTSIDSVVGNYLSFWSNGGSLILNQLPKKHESIIQNDFTLEFNIKLEGLPSDENFYQIKQNWIKILSVYNNESKNILSFGANRFDRFAVFAVGENFQSTWNNKTNYALTRIFRGKWYHVALVYNDKNEELTLYLDGEIAGKATVDLRDQKVSKFIFGYDPTIDHQQFFSGGLASLTLLSEIKHDIQSSKNAKKNNRAVILEESKELYSHYLLNENDSWKSNHPRMLITPASLEVLKHKLNTSEGEKLKKKLLKHCNNLIDPNSKYFLEKFKTGHSIYNVMAPAELCLATLLSGEERYAEHAAKIVNEFAQTRGYHDVAHHLVQSAGMGKSTMSIALTYDWGYQYLTDEQKRNIRLFLLQMAKGTYEFYCGGETNSGRKDALRGWVANWTAMSVTNLGMSTLAVLGETKGAELRWLEYAKFRSLQYGKMAIDNSGAFHEMPHYFGFGAAPLLVFMQSLSTAGGQDLLKDSNFSKYPEFLAYLLNPKTKSVVPLKYWSTGASGYSGLQSGMTGYVYALLRHKFPGKAIEWDWQVLYGDEPWGNHEWSMFSLIWFEPSKPKVASPGLPLTKWFRGEGVVAFRNSWDNDAINGIIMAYPAKIMAHDQADRGQFVLNGFQGRWIIDSGGRNGPQYDTRDAHNLITIDNQSEIYKPLANFNRHLDGFITSVANLESFGIIAEANLTNSYQYIYNWEHLPVSLTGEPGTKDDFVEAKRHVVFIRDRQSPSYCLVYDQIQKDDKEHEYTLNLHTAPENQVLVQNNAVKMHKYANHVSEINYITVPESDENSRKYYYKNDPSGGFAEYDILIPASGKYCLYGFGASGEKNPGAMDSFFVSVNNKKYIWSTSSSAEYSWVKINDKPMQLTKGNLKIKLTLREPEARAGRLALCPADTLPLFNKPNNSSIIFIDAAMPVAMANGFVQGSEVVSDNDQGASMLLHQIYPSNRFKKDIFEGKPLDHYRLTSTQKAVRGKFLNLFYPHNASMPVPNINIISDNQVLVEWPNCQDLICFDLDGSGAGFENFKSDSELLVVRKQKDMIVSIIFVNGTYIRDVLELRGGSGSLIWNEDSISVTGKDVFNLRFKFPGNSNRSIKKIIVNEDEVPAVNTEQGWSASSPFVTRSVLSW